MATDIAFVVGILALFGKRIPFGLKVFLLTLAIVDDLIAVLVIAFVFTDSISFVYGLAAATGCGLTYLLHKLGVRSVMVYVIIGIGIWLLFFNAGIHTTIAGVILGLMTPTKDWITWINHSMCLGNKAWLDTVTGWSLLVCIYRGELSLWHWLYDVIVSYFTHLCW
jgi:Na+:H+ antiporter, NhaA family